MGEKKSAGRQSDKSNSDRRESDTRKSTPPANGTSETSNSNGVNGHSSAVNIGRGSPLFIGGARRRRVGASLRSLGKSILLPDDLARTRGLRFSSDKATKDQEQALKRLIKKYMQLVFVTQFADAGAEAIKSALNCGESTAHALVKEASKTADPWRELLIDVLTGMYSGALAGPLGTSKTSCTKWLFSEMQTYGPSDIPQDGSADATSMGQLLAMFRADCLEWQYRRGK